MRHNWNPEVAVRPDTTAIVEETSHLVCLVWPAERGRAVSRPHLELQAEVDRWQGQLTSVKMALADEVAENSRTHHETRQKAKKQ